MFIGHYGAAFLLKKKYNKVPLWTLFISVLFVDILTFIFLLFGLEKMNYNPSNNPFLRTTYEYYPFTHSLLGTIVISLVVFFIFSQFKDRTWGLALSLGVLSHWLIDFIVHIPDLALINNNFKVGLGLWNFPWIAFLIEVAFFVGSGYYLFRNSKNFKKSLIIICLGVLLFTPTMFSPDQEVPIIAMVITSLISYFIFTCLAYWVEKKKSKNSKKKLFVS
jgi:hypothetical protein